VIHYNPNQHIGVQMTKQITEEDVNAGKKRAVEITNFLFENQTDEYIRDVIALAITYVSVGLIVGLTSGQLMTIISATLDEAHQPGGTMQ
jgi:hypothetical protein